MTLSIEPRAPILLIDDDEDAFILTRDMFSEFIERNYTLEWVDNYTAGLDAMIENRHAAYLVDYVLGGRTGLDLVREARERGCTNPIIFLTGMPSREVDLNAMNAGASDFLVKGELHTNLLERSIRYSIQHQQTLNELKTLTDALQVTNEQLRRSEAELRDLNASKDRFFSIIAHDLKSPFVALLGFSDLLLDASSNLSQEEVQTLAGRMSNAANNLFKLLENLLQWSRIQTRRLEFEPVAVDLHTVLASVLSVYIFNAEKKQITMHNLVDPNTMCFVDRTALTVVIENLLSNAIKFSRSGGSILITSCVRGGAVEIQIADTGIGIDPAVIERLFRIDQHVTRPGTANEQGTGLGLILCKELLDKSNGSIRVESTPGSGTTFIITIPMHAVLEPMEAA